MSPPIPFRAGALASLFVAAFAVCAPLAAQPAPSQPNPSQPEAASGFSARSAVTGTSAMVATANPHASRAAM
ncbi:MAG: hypothetical protein ACOYLX_09175, partial [Burkholderiaceae bacterium]